MKTMVLKSIAALVAMTTMAVAADQYTYSTGDVICRDHDGFLVNGSDAWGNGYFISDVEEAYGLKGKSKSHKFVSSC